jgi:hypothetical protein
VTDARVESEVRRNRDDVRIRMLVNAAARDPGQAAAAAWLAFLGAAGENAAAWDMATAAASGGGPRP